MAIINLNERLSEVAKKIDDEFIVVRLGLVDSNKWYNESFCNNCYSVLNSTHKAGKQEVKNIYIPFDKLVEFANYELKWNSSAGKFENVITFDKMFNTLKDLIKGFIYDYESKHDSNSVVFTHTNKGKFVLQEVEKIGGDYARIRTQIEFADRQNAINKKQEEKTKQESKAKQEEKRIQRIVKFNDDLTQYVASGYFEKSREFIAKQLNSIANIDGIHPTIEEFLNSSIALLSTLEEKQEVKQEVKADSKAKKQSKGKKSA